MDGNFKDHYLTMSGIDQTTENTTKISQLDKGISEFLTSTVPNFLLIVAVPQTIKGVKTFVEQIVGTGMKASEGFLSLVCDKYTSITMDTRTGIILQGAIRVPDNSFSINATKDLESRLKSIASAQTTTGVADKSITNEKLADKTITNEKLADEAITSAKIKAGTILSANVGLLTIQGLNLASETIDNRVLADACIKPRNITGMYIVAIPFSPTNYTVNVAKDVSFYGSDTAPFMSRFSYPTAYTILALTALFDKSLYTNEATIELFMESVRGTQSVGKINIPSNNDKMALSIMLPTPIPISQNTSLQILHTFKTKPPITNVKKVRYVLHAANA